MTGRKLLLRLKKPVAEDLEKVSKIVGGFTEEGASLEKLRQGVIHALHSCIVDGNDMHIEKDDCAHILSDLKGGIMKAALVKKVLKLCGWNNLIPEDEEKGDEAPL